ncbi:haloacid dehalogenase [Aureimonas endophytica]|uniref:Haloacid dehalogenase n=1 Tax=Aureimonas endophytica TaxID=2027858 RepID=A0A917E3B0_9HYPH|nr:TIGR01459 family HAD-type hydrolase [Aureimonas endophytica]GGD99497.1 haloacid dehalogenase [Aureimonas endophytica]
MNAPEAIASLAAVAPAYKAIFCDVWGVVHDGVAKHAAAEAALTAARRAGCHVVLLTNSPRPNEGVRRQLDGLSFSPEAYDAIVTSGDVTRRLIAETGRPLLHVGPQRDLDLFAGLAAEFVDEARAEAVIVTGLHDDTTETPADYAPLLERLKRRDLPMICANPDVVVHRGERLIFCAGAIARDYERLGGRVAMAGKPHAPIYAEAQRVAGVAGPAEVLAVGDGLNTDIRGANAYGADALLIMAGVHRDELGGFDVAGEVLGAHLGGQDLAARFFMPRLV